MAVVYYLELSPPHTLLEKEAKLTSHMGPPNPARQVHVATGWLPDTPLLHVPELQ